MTTRRPTLTHRARPSSQVYIGADSLYSSYLSSPPDLPDLPEPPSPGSSTRSSTSGLPSPPATNSTGSGSTGDPGSIAVRGGLNMLNGSNIKTFHAAFQSADHHDDEGDDYDNDNDHDDDGEDNTARLDQRRHSASENVLALQRVKSLTQRNKMALDKLSSFSRLTSPAPSSRPASATRSPHPPAPPSLLASSSSSSSSTSTSNSISISHSTSNNSNSTSNSASSHSSSSHSSTSARPALRRARTQDAHHPFGSVQRRHGSGGAGPQEHTKLMGDSLAMFEAQLARVGGGVGGGAADLARSAQALVGAAERLNAILRAGTGRALEEQIDAEVSGVDSGAAAVELAEVWRRVGGEYREGLRVSDELVRGVTGFLLGVGRVVRDFGDGRGSEEGRGSVSPEAGRDGRRSAESRRSWEAKDRGGRESALGVRPASVLNVRGHEPTPPSAPRTATPSSRRLLTPREQRELNASGGIVASDSLETVLPRKAGYEPSPTPASRKPQLKQGTLDRSRTLPPISIPKPLPSLPSESASTLRRNQTVGDKPVGMSQQRRRTLTSSTVRAAGGSTGLLPSMTTPTTAVTTHTVSNSPQERDDARMAFPALPRNDSDKSVPTRSRNNTVTFSRPSTVALAGLQMQHARERQRTISGSGTFEENRAAAAPAAGPSDAEKKRSVAGRERPRMSLDGGAR
ncbi:hypothetical protein B0H17DRAFT_698449 [Mycena rosella]|uniref:Uncharacterized protein n=1 Tax=Mycena rosella TaxID=1033263 RepID=A0AAD7GTK5_MYCRO|nr:hypothetical protein B0H17DRAFT_698449 [Mycena rosella]